MDRPSADNLITLMVFQDGFKANLMRVKLEDSGVQAFLFDENVATVQPLYNHLVGGIKLKVRESDRETAEEILSAANTFPLEDKAGNVIVCPRCGSENVEPGSTGIRSTKSFLAFVVGVLTLTYPLHLDLLYSCGSCNHFFRKSA